MKAAMSRSSSASASDERDLAAAAALQAPRHVVERAPVVQRQALAQLRGDAQQLLQVAGEAGRGVVHDRGAQDARRLGRLVGAGAPPRRGCRSGAAGRRCPARRASRSAGRFLDHAQQRHAQQPRDVVAALGVAAEPVQVLHHAAGKVEAGAHQVLRPDSPLQQAEGADRAGRQHPGVLARAAALHGDDARIGAGGRARQAARHHDVAVRAGAGEDAQADGARAQQLLRMRAVADRRLRQLHQFLRDVHLRARAAASRRRASRPRSSRSSPNIGSTRICGIRALDHQLVELRQHVASAAGSPHHQVATEGMLQRLAEQPLAQPRQEAEQRAGFEQVGAERVGDQHVAAARRVDQARRCRAPSRCAVRADRSSRRPGGAGSRARAAGPRASSARPCPRAPSGRCPRPAGSRGSARGRCARNRFRCSGPGVSSTVSGARAVGTGAQCARLSRSVAKNPARRCTFRSRNRSEYRRETTSRFSSA